MSETGLNLAAADLPVWDDGSDPSFGLDFDAYAAALFAEPYQGLRRVAGEPGGGYGDDSGVVAYRNLDLRRLMADPALSNVPPDILARPLAQPIPDDGDPGYLKCFRHSVFTQHPPAHGPSKKLFAKQLTVGSLTRYRAQAQALVRERVSHLAGAGQVDLRKDVAEPVVAAFWSHVLGLSHEEVVHVSDLAVRLQRANEFNLSDEDRRDINAAGERYFADFNQLLRRGIDGGQVEFLADLAADFHGMGDVGRPDSLEAHFGVSLIDGLHTLPAEMVSVIYALSMAPECLAEVRSDPSLISDAYHEGTRLHPGVTTTQRFVIADTELDGLAIPAGTTIMMLWLLGNRDPAAFEAPNQFRLGRRHRQDTTFGGGAHICPGRNIVKMLCEITLAELTRPGVTIAFSDHPRWSVASAIHEPLSAPVYISID